MSTIHINWCWVSSINSINSIITYSSAHTVDGRNPAPVEVGSLSNYLQGFLHPRWLFGISSIITYHLSNVFPSWTHQLPSPPRLEEERYVRPPDGTPATLSEVLRTDQQMLIWQADLFWDGYLKISQVRWKTVACL